MRCSASISRSNAAFTLLELVISAAIGAMILTAAALCLNASIASQKMIDPRVDAMQCARVALALMSADLRAACPLDKSYAFLGDHRVIGDMEADNIDFATHNYSPRHPREGDYCETSYFWTRVQVRVNSVFGADAIQHWRSIRSPAAAARRLRRELPDCGWNSTMGWTGTTPGVISTGGKAAI